jgi:hypothetical protein
MRLALGKMLDGMFTHAPHLFDSCEGRTFIKDHDVEVTWRRSYKT